MKFLLFLWNTSIHYLLRLLVMSVFIHFQHFMEDSIASPIELQQVMYVLTNFVYIYEYKQTLWIPVLNCKINSAAVLSKTVPWDLFSFSYCIICKHIHALTPKGSRQGRVSTCTYEIEFCRMGAAAAMEWSTACSGGTVECPLPPPTPGLALAAAAAASSWLRPPSPDPTHSKVEMTD